MTAPLVAGAPAVHGSTLPSMISSIKRSTTAAVIFLPFSGYGKASPLSGLRTDSKPVSGGSGADKVAALPFCFLFGFLFFSLLPPSPRPTD